MSYYPKTGIIKYNLSAYLTEFEQNGIVYRKIEPHKKKARGNKGSDIYYYIGPIDTASSQEKLDIFQLILRSSTVELESDLQKNLLAKLLASKYVNSLIAICGLKPIYEIFKEYMERGEFRSIASQRLLSQPALIEEYINYTKVLKETPELAYGLKINPDLGNKDLIAALSNFDPVNAVEFYRKIINDTFSKMYREVTDSVLAGAIKEFTDYDVLLSPFTSYPRNNPAYLLLQRPFERIYNDAYILNEIDYKNFIKRAYVVYSHFAKILSIVIDNLRFDEMELLDYRFEELERYNDMTDKDLRRDNSGALDYIRHRWNYLHNIKDHIETVVKLSIYNWNIASYRFDLVKSCLQSEGRYHILSDNVGIQIIDLQTGKPHLSPDESREIMSSISLLSGPEDPFAKLWPCNAFYDLDLNPRVVTYDEILEEVKSSLI